jgi:hypothetical protein
MTLMPVRVRAPFAQAGVKAADAQTPQSNIPSLGGLVVVGVFVAALIVGNYYYQSATIARGIRLAR